MSDTQMKAAAGVPLFATERRQLILQHARTDGRVDAKELSARFNVTTETVRRDLIHLQNAGLLTRVHGGALISDRLIPGVSERDGSMSEEKWAIARAAAESLPERGAIIIDAGTTTSKLATLVPDSALSVLTNSLQVVNILIEKPEIDVLVLGGSIDRVNMATSDAWALEPLSRIAVDVAYIGTTGLSPSLGLSTQDPLEASVKGAMIAAAHRVVVLADHSKIGTNRMHVFANAAQIDLLITDSGVDSADLAAFRALGVEVQVVPARTLPTLSRP